MMQIADGGEPGASPPSCFPGSAWQLWVDATPRPGWENMAIDMALHARARRGECWLRLYRWDPACLSFGRHEPALRRYDRAAIESLGLDTVRRPTGGRAVWHDRELTYAVAAPDAVTGTLPVAYRVIHATLAEAVGSLGAPVSLAPTPSHAAGLDAGACFASAAGGEVVSGTEKVAGSAQLRTEGAMLQHGSILLEDDQARISEVASASMPPARVRPLRAMLGRPASWEELASAVATAAGRWGDAWTAIPAPDAIVNEAAAFANRFRDPAWTWQR